MSGSGVSELKLGAVACKVTSSTYKGPALPAANAVLGVPVVQVATLKFDTPDAPLVLGHQPTPG